MSCRILVKESSMMSSVHIRIVLLALRSFKEFESLGALGFVLAQSSQYCPQLLDFGNLCLMLSGSRTAILLELLHCRFGGSWFSYSLVLSRYVGVASDLLQQSGLDQLEVGRILESVLACVEEHVWLGFEDEVLEDLTGCLAVVHQPVSVLKGFISAECDVMSSIDFSDMRYDSVQLVAEFGLVLSFVAFFDVAVGYALVDALVDGVLVDPVQHVLVDM